MKTWRNVRFNDLSFLFDIPDGRTRKSKKKSDQHFDRSMRKIIGFVLFRFVTSIRKSSSTKLPLRQTKKRSERNFPERSRVFLLFRPKSNRCFLVRSFRWKPILLLRSLIRSDSSPRNRKEPKLERSTLTNRPNFLRPSNFFSRRRNEHEFLSLRFSKRNSFLIFVEKKQRWKLDRKVFLDDVKFRFTKDKFYVWLRWKMSWENHHTDSRKRVRLFGWTAELERRWTMFRIENHGESTKLRLTENYWTLDDRSLSTRNFKEKSDSSSFKQTCWIQLSQCKKKWMSVN